MTTKRGEVSRLRPWRRLAELAQAAVALSLPFLRVNGESALRFDLASLRLHVFGATLWMDELFVVLAATLFVCFAFLLVTVLFGRVWCGWGCPQTALVDLSGFLGRARDRGGWRLGAAYASIGLGSALVAANLTWYFVPPGEFLRDLASLSLGPTLSGIWFALAAVLFADLAFWRHGFCATTCPYAKLQGALLDRHAMVVAYDVRRDQDCIDCKACLRCCPVGIDIRDGLQSACTACTECIDACRPIMARLRKPPDLIGYSFGVAGTPRRLLRPASIALGILTVAALGLTAAVAADRQPLEVTLAGSDFAPRRTAAGEVYNALTLALENRGREPLVLALSVSVPGAVGATFELRPDTVRLAAGEHRRLRVMAVGRGLPPGAASLPTRLSATSTGGAGATRELTLTVPEASR